MGTDRRGRGARVTIDDIAQRAGVSISAVSFALNGRKGVSEKTRMRVMQVADELGWAPASAARSLAEAKTDTVGMVLTRDPHNLGVETFHMRFLAGLESELAARSFGLLLQVVPTPERELATLRAWQRAQRVDGVLLTDINEDDPRTAMFAGAGSLAAVAVGDPSVTRGITTVWTDDAAGIRASVDHLARWGHRRIAHVSGLGHLAHTAIRRREFVRHASELGLDPIVLATDYSPQVGAQVTREALAAAAPPTAFIYDNDVMAVAGLSAVAEAGLAVPGDVSIVAWDDSVLCEHTFPTLTALSHDIVAYGAHVARRLFEVIDGAAPAAHLDSTPTLRSRASTGPARG